MSEIYSMLQFIRQMQLMQSIKQIQSEFESNAQEILDFERFFWNPCDIVKVAFRIV